MGYVPAEEEETQFLPLHVCCVYDDYDDADPDICTIIVDRRGMGGIIAIHFLFWKIPHTGVHRYLGPMPSK
jgi:hypothetical protein